MRLPLNQKDLVEMVRVALKDKAPQSYRELEMSNQLQEFLLDLADQMREAAYALHFEATQKALKQAEKEGKDNPIQLAAAANTALHQADEYILATYLEFSDPPTSTQSLET